MIKVDSVKNSGYVSNIAAEPTFGCRKKKMDNPIKAEAPDTFEKSEGEGRQVDEGEVKTMMIASAIIPGLSSFINHKTTKGEIMLIGALVGDLAFLPVGLLFHLWSAIDAYKNCTKAAK